MKILIAPLNWGLGHATRSIPIIRHYLAKGDEVVLGGDGESILLLKQTFPDLRVIDLPSLEKVLIDNIQNANAAGSKIALYNAFSDFENDRIETCNSCVMNREQYIVSREYKKHYKLNFTITCAK